MRQHPRGSILQQPLHQRRVHRVSSTLSHNTPPYPLTRKSQIADQVQHLVPHKFIIKAKRPILYTFARQNDRARI